MIGEVHITYRANQIVNLLRSCTTQFNHHFWTTWLVDGAMFGSEHIWRTVLFHPSLFATYGLWYQFSLHHFSLATVTAHLSLNMIWYIITNILERSRPWSRFWWTRFPVELEQVAPVCRPVCSVDGPQQARRDSWLEIVQVYSPALLPGIDISPNSDSHTSVWWCLTTAERGSRLCGMQRKSQVWYARANFYFELCRTFPHLDPAGSVILAANSRGLLHG